MPFYYICICNIQIMKVKCNAKNIYVGIITILAYSKRKHFIKIKKWNELTKRLKKKTRSFKFRANKLINKTRV